MVLLPDDADIEFEFLPVRWQPTNTAPPWDADADAADD